MESEVKGNPRKSGISRLLKSIGFLITILCILYVGRALAEQKDVLREVALSPGILWRILFSMVLWVGFNGLLGIGWMSLIRASGQELSPRSSVEIALLSQAAKYLPGNVFHLAGRVWYARKRGISTQAAVAATGIESVRLVLIAASLGLPLLLTLPYADIVLVGFVIVGVAIVLSVFLGRLRFFGLEKFLRFGNSLVRKRYIGLALIAYISVFLIQTMTFMLFAAATRIHFFEGKFFESIQIVSSTWLAGFITIGSPGGLGVREAAFALFTHSPALLSQLLVVATLMRISSIGGDLLSLAIGGLLRKDNY